MILLTLRVQMVERSCLRIKDIIIQVLRFLSVQINERNFPTGYSLPMVVFLTEEDFDTNNSQTKNEEDEPMGDEVYDNSNETEDQNNDEL